MSFTTTPLNASYDLSANGKMTIGGEDLGGFKDGSLTIEGETVDNFSRGDGGWSYTAPGRRSASVEVTFLKKQADACQVGLRELALDPDYPTKGVQIVYRSEKNTTSAGTGFKGTFILTNYEESQTDGGDAVECTASFASFGPIVADNAAESGGSGGSGGSEEN